MNLELLSLVLPDDRIKKSLVRAHFVLVNTSGRVDSFDSEVEKNMWLCSIFCCSYNIFYIFTDKFHHLRHSLLIIYKLYCFKFRPCNRAQWTGAKCLIPN